MQDHLIQDVKYKDGSYKLAYITSIQNHPSWYSHFDEANVRERIWNIQPNDCVLDVGAAYGSYTLTALFQGASKTYSWSPEAGCGDAKEQIFLKESLRLNGWQDKGTVYDTGFYDKEGYLDTTTQIFYDKMPSQVPNPDFFIKVSTLDSWYQDVFLKENDPKSFNKIWMKVDVEGAEVGLLNGAKQLITELKPNITVENHLFKRGSIKDEVANFILPLGYTEHSTEPYYSVSHSLYLTK
jgi:FkbM family methyltransferase